jgi:perosamine synthetase
MTRFIPIAKPIIGRKERRAVISVLKSGSLTQGSEVVSFEKEFSALVEDRECVAVNSGTSALHLALISLGIGPGNEVLVPSFTFAASANAIVLAGAQPIFIDIDSETFNLNPELIERAITRNTKAIVVVHLYGLPAHMEAILAVAKKRNLLVIEDAAQAHMSSINGKPVGSFGDAAAFSFYPTKNMTSGEGGMIVFKDEQCARIARLLRNQGMEIRYSNEIVGFNLRMTDIHASIGRVQLKKLPAWTSRRQENASILSDQLVGVKTPLTPSGYSHVFHQYTIKVNSNRNHFEEVLKHKNIGCGVYYPLGVHQLPSFKHKINNLPITESIVQKVLSLPVHPSLSRNNLKRIIKVVNSIAQEEL